MSGAWTAAVAAYLEARRAELAFAAVHINPTIPASLPIGPERSQAVDAIAPEIWEQSQRLTDICGAAEDVLMAIEAPDASGLAFKLLVARHDERAADGWDAMLMAEALRFAPSFLVPQAEAASQ